MVVKNKFMVVSNKNPINKMNHAKNQKKVIFDFSENSVSMFNHVISGSKANNLEIIYMINYTF